MKNVILTHKELQKSIFEAFSAQRSLKEFNKNWYLITESTDRDFVWKVMDYPTEESCASSGRVVTAYYVNKFAYQLNDIRIHAGIQYLTEQFRYFTQELERHANGLPEVPKVKAENLPTPPVEDLKLHNLLTASRHLIKYLNENHHPHAKVIVTTTGAELLYGKESTGEIMEYVKD